MTGSTTRGHLGSLLLPNRPFVGDPGRRGAVGSTVGGRGVTRSWTFGVLPSLRPAGRGWLTKEPPGGSRRGDASAPGGDSAAAPTGPAMPAASTRRSAERVRRTTARRARLAHDHDPHRRQERPKGMWLASLAGDVASPRSRGRGLRSGEAQEGGGVGGGGHGAADLLAQRDGLGDQLGVGRLAVAAEELEAEVQVAARARGRRGATSLSRRRRRRPPTRPTGGRSPRAARGRRRARVTVGGRPNGAPVRPRVGREVELHHRALRAAGRRAATRASPAGSRARRWRGYGPRRSSTWMSNVAPIRSNELV